MSERKIADVLKHHVVLRSDQNCIYKVCFRIVCSATFNILITTLIIFNTYILAVYRYD